MSNDSRADWVSVVGSIGVGSGIVREWPLMSEVPSEQAASVRGETRVDARGGRSDNL